ncbi:MAG: D-serine ammonia-lyase [Clostridia bacterium]|nr:D-serine ammonia-lyase [Clostridia bacterium]
MDILSKKVLDKTVAEWINAFPLIKDIMNENEVLWTNPALLPFDDALKTLTLTKEDIDDASRRLDRFRSYFKRVFPETAEADGLIESPLYEALEMRHGLTEKYGVTLPSQLLIKLDSHLPISGSIKARGGIYEVLTLAERIAIAEGGLKETDDYAILADEKYKRLFSKYSVAVGSTGNLGLSIGIMSAKLGFRVTVHMSADAREWKKDMLRSKGVTVVEYENDYSVAVENGRREAEGDPFCHFIDDENSTTLFLGYSVAAERLRRQLDNAGIIINEENPLYVYLPCGVGGGPGGVAFGLKMQFGDNVHCFYAEPTHSPCMILGMLTGEHNKISVGDFGIDNRTIADGLAVGRASGFVGKETLHLMDGCYTVKDERLSALLKLLADKEDIYLEPSALAGAFGPVILARSADIPQGVHLVWATGGSMVPKDEMKKYYMAGEAVYGKY